jgi:hypothetical protein
VLSTDALLIVYYFGLGFIAILGWAAIAGDLLRPFDDGRRARWNRASAILAIAGVVHPAVPWIARDIARQAARTSDDEPRPNSPYVTLATVCAAIALTVAGAVITAARQ